MAVSSSFTLPNQPTSGTVTFVPLGGDGFSAPQAAYSVVNHNVTGAAGGGAATLTVIMDPRFVSLVAYATARNDQVSSADADLRLIVTSQSGGRQIPQVTLEESVTAIAAAVNITTIARTWNPTPVLLPGAGQAGQLVMNMLNVANDEYFLSALIYLFDIRVRELSPTGPLLWSRGAT